MQRAKLLKDNRKTRHLHVWDPAFHMYQNHVDLDHKDVSTHNSLLEMLFTDAAHRGKLFRGQDLFLGSCKDHMGPQTTLMVAADSDPGSPRACTRSPMAHHPLLLILGHQSLTHRVLGSRITHALLRAPCSTIHSTYNPLAPALF